MGAAVFILTLGGDCTAIGAESETDYPFTPTSKSRLNQSIFLEPAEMKLLA
jgi:hypothetical protein